MTHDDLAPLLSRIGASGDLDALGRLFDLAAPGLLRLALRGTGDAAGQVAAVKEDGTYTVTGLDAGSVDVRVAGPFADSDPVRVVVKSGEPATADFNVATSGAIRIDVPMGTLPTIGMTATVTPLEGGTSLKLARSAAEFETRIARNDGFTLRRVAPGRYRVDVTWDGRSIYSDEIDVADRVMAKVDAKP